MKYSTYTPLNKGSRPLNVFLAPYSDKLRHLYEENKPGFLSRGLHKMRTYRINGTF